MKSGGERLDQPDLDVMRIVEVDSSAIGTVWVAASTTVGMMLATLATLLAGFSLTCVVAMGVVTISLAQLTIAAAIHYRPLHVVPGGES